MGFEERGRRGRGRETEKRKETGKGKEQQQQKPLNYHSANIKYLTMEPFSLIILLTSAGH